MDGSFAAYVNGQFSFEGRDEAMGVLGTLDPGDNPPVLTAHTLEELEPAAWAYLGHDPSAVLYLVDSGRCVRKMLLSSKHHEEMDRIGRHMAVSVAALVFCLTCLVSTAFGPSGTWVVVAFGVATALYGLIVRSQFLNEVEAAILVELVLVLALILVPVFLHARAVTRKVRPSITDTQPIHAAESAVAAQIRTGLT